MKKKSITEMFEAPLKKTFEEVMDSEVITNEIPYRTGIKKLPSKQLKELISFAESEITEYDAFIHRIKEELRGRRK